MNALRTSAELTPLPEQPAPPWVRMMARSIVRSTYRALTGSAIDERMLLSFLDAAEAVRNDAPAEWEITKVARFRIEQTDLPTLTIQAARPVPETVDTAFAECHAVERIDECTIRITILPSRIVMDTRDPIIDLLEAENLPVQ